MNKMDDFYKLLDKYYHKDLSIETIAKELNISKNDVLSLLDEYMDIQEQEEWENYNKSLI